MIKRLIGKLFLGEELREVGWEIDREAPVEEACFVVFDTETTGLDLKKDEAISIGAVKIENLRIDLGKVFYALMKPTKEYADSIKVHGITPQDLEKAEERKKVCEDFLEYARGCILAGYFLDIDRAMLKKLIRQECSAKLRAYSLDLLDMVREEGKVPTLEELLSKSGLSAPVIHNALEDAYMTAIVFLKFLKNYRKVKELPLKPF